MKSPPPTIEIMKDSHDSRIRAEALELGGEDLPAEGVELVN